jgi:hypothetical protein
VKLTWKDIAQAAKAGKLRYALSNPATSNQGFMALMGVVAAAGGKSEALNAADVNRGAIADFLKGYKIPGDNSTYLSEQFILQQGTKANAFINYESWLLSLNASGKLREKLRLIYPFEGVSTADYPFMLLDEQRRADYLKVAEYLKGEAAQTWLARQTLRRPIKPEVAAKVEDLLPKSGPAGRAAVLARPRAGRRADRRLPQRVPHADRQHLRARHQRQHAGRRPPAAAGAGHALHRRRRRLADRPHRQADQPREGVAAAVLRHALRLHRASRCRPQCGHRQGRGRAGRQRRQAEGAGRRARLCREACR